MRSSQAQFAPLQIGARLWIGPSWHEPPAGRVAVRIDPGLAFGTGSASHDAAGAAVSREDASAAASACSITAAARVYWRSPPRSSAPARVDGVDIDPQALETAARQCARQTASSCSATLPEALPAAAYDIVVSNILAQPLILLAPAARRAHRAGGRIALAGILESQAEEVARRLRAVVRREARRGARRAGRSSQGERR